MLGKSLINQLQARKTLYGLAGLSSALYFLGFCGFGWSYLSLICLVPIFFALDGEALKTKEVIGISWFFGFCTHLGGYWWLVGFFERFAHVPLVVAILLYCSLCVAQGSLLGAWAFSLHALQRHFSIPKALSAAPMMILFEWLWPALFPSYLSNSLYQHSTQVQALDLVGPLGLSGLVTLFSAVVYRLLTWHLRRETFPSGLLALLMLLNALNTGYGLWTIERIEGAMAAAERSLTVGLAQSNMGIYEKRKDPREGVVRHRRLSLELQGQGADLIVWPESGFQYAIPDETHNVKRSVFGPELQTPLLFGGLRLGPADDQREIYNTAFLADGEGQILGTYDKTYLLAFGEYLPLGDTFPWLYELSPYTSKFSPGTHTKPLELGELKLGVLICYEDILPRFVRQVMAHQPDILMNLTNDAWFGDTHEPVIHLALATFRSVEHRRYMVRSTNTGISAIIDPLGRIVAQTPTFEEATLLTELKAISLGPTLYGRWGDWIAWVSLAGMTLWIMRQRRRLSEPPAPS